MSEQQSLTVGGCTAPAVETHLNSGSHLILDLYNCQCDVEKLESLDQGMDFLNRIGKFFSVLGNVTHQFKPSGYTALLLLAESHCSAHSWPEHRFISIDVYCCNRAVPEEVEVLIMDEFRPSNVKRVYIERGGPISN